MTRSPDLDVGRYFKGDILLVRCAEPDPFEGWPQFTEDNAHDLRSVRLDGQLVGVIGYFVRSPTEADSFALIDREACPGLGLQLAGMIRSRQLQWMEEIGVTRAWADCPLNDRKAQVFLRAIGYRRVEGDKPDTAFFALDWRR